MCFTLLILIPTLSAIISWLSVAWALSISFPPDGKPTAALDTQMVKWQRDKNDPNSQFVLRKIKLDCSRGPATESTVPIMNSQKNQGMSQMVFNRAGLFEIVAIDENFRNNQNFFTTEITVLPNPTLIATSSQSSATNTVSRSKYVYLRPISSFRSKGTNRDMMYNSLSSKTPLVTVTITSVTSSGSLASDDSTKMTTSAASNVPENRGDTAAIIGSIVGSVVLLFLIGVILLFLRYRTRRRTIEFSQTKMVRDYVPDTVEGSTWHISDRERDSIDYSSESASFPPARRNTLRPQDSVSNIHDRHAPLILPPIPAARPVSSTVPDSVTSTSSVRRARDTERKTPSISLSNLSSSNGSTGTGFLFPIPVLPPRPRTDRQMSIEEEIQQLQARMLFLQGNGNTSPIGSEKEEEMKKIYRKVETLKKLHESKWALGLTDEISV
ncbi:hypothetical protein EV368DRAFT_67145 [Lentinula lateritia]|uniref:Uncharacterized protein n=1 Tax=Lentinula aff. lateritia TaxID=2804960 RepID=A0ACC1TQK0_9AGAR|nr:hypothetical protein F5876DRAFT_68597 [Lentinula aff. lateritia]KAJ3849795.1 hypothetical protein EV368DRAFT_67145 [Lentinula lateritia]